MMFGQAIDDVIRYDVKARRSCWNDDVFIGFRLPDDKSDLTGAYFYQVGYYDDVLVTVPWIPDTFDMTAHDWNIFDVERN